MSAPIESYDTIFFPAVSIYCRWREVLAGGERLRCWWRCYGPDTVRIAPHFFIYGPKLAASSGTGGTPADADGPDVLEAEAALLAALDRLSTAASDVAWQEAVSARDTALRRLLRAVSVLSLVDRELVVTRATQLMSRERPV